MRRTEIKELQLNIKRQSKSRKWLAELDSCVGNWMPDPTRWEVRREVSAALEDSERLAEIKEWAKSLRKKENTVILLIELEEFLDLEEEDEY